MQLWLIAGRGASLLRASAGGWGAETPLPKVAGGLAAPLIGPKGTYKACKTDKLTFMHEDLLICRHDLSRGSATNRGARLGRIELNRRVELNRRTELSRRVHKIRKIHKLFCILYKLHNSYVVYFVFFVYFVYLAFLYILYFCIDDSVQFDIRHSHIRWR